MTVNIPNVALLVELICFAWFWPVLILKGLDVSTGLNQEECIRLYLGEGPEAHLQVDFGRGTATINLMRELDLAKLEGYSACSQRIISLDFETALLLAEGLFKKRPQRLWELCWIHVPYPGEVHDAVERTLHSETHLVIKLVLLQNISHLLRHQDQLIVSLFLRHGIEQILEDPAEKADLLLSSALVVLEAGSSVHSELLLVEAFSFVHLVGDLFELIAVSYKLLVHLLLENLLLHSRVWTSVVPIFLALETIEVAELVIGAVIAEIIVVVDGLVVEVIA